MKYMLEDLKFFIGAFFLIVGILLGIEGLVHPIQTETYNLNLICGITFIVFALIPLGISIKERAIEKL